MVILSSCRNETDVLTPENADIDWRSLKVYTLPYQSSSSEILTQTGDDLDDWSSDYSAISTSILYGTSSTMYLGWDPTIPNPIPPYNPGGFEDRPIFIFQNSSNEIKWVELNNDSDGWTSPASVSSATSALLPSIENVDGVVLEAHVGSSDWVYGSVKSGSSWSTPGYLYRNTVSAPYFARIESHYSPTVEYHLSAAVEYLVTGEFDPNISGYGLPRIFWRYTSTNYTETTAPGITLGAAGGEFNASLTPVAVDNNGNDKLYMFYTDPGTSTASDNLIRYLIGSVTGGTDGSITSWSSSYTISSSAITTSKIDGIYTNDTEIIAITYRNSGSGNIDVAYSSDFGANWTIEAGIDSTPGAPSLCNVE